MPDLTDKTLITEEDLRNAPFGATLHINEHTLVTPLAADLAGERQIQFERAAAATARRPPEKDRNQCRTRATLK